MYLHSFTIVSGDAVDTYTSYIHRYINFNLKRKIAKNFRLKNEKIKHSLLYTFSLSNYTSYYIYLFQKVIKDLIMHQ